MPFLPTPPAPSRLLPGDVLLYSRKGVYNWIISVKTWSDFTHVEVMGRRGKVYASRNGKGCGHYDFAPDGLALILRPPLTRVFSIDRAARWFISPTVLPDDTVIPPPSRQGYDWIGLLNFVGARWQGPHNGKMFCSEFATRFLRAGGLDLFPGVDADTISPRDFTLIGLDPVWAADEAGAE